VTRAHRLSALDAMFLPMETATQSLHVGSVLVLEGPAPDPAEFREHVVAGLVGVPAHRRRVRRMPWDLGRPIWVDATNDQPADHVHHATLAGPGDESQLRSLVARLMVPALDAGRPLWEMWQVDGLTEGRWAVVAKAHHTMADGQSGVDLVQSLLADGPEATPRRRVEVVEPWPDPSIGGLARDLVEWALCLPLRATRLLLRSLRHPREARGSVRQLRFGLSQVLRPDLPPSVLTGPLSVQRAWGWTGADLAGVTRLARTAGCTVNDVFLAALSGGYRRYLLGRGESVDDLVLRAIVPVSRRRPGEPGQPGQPGRTGNLSSAMFVDLPVDLAEPAARLAAVAARTAEQKSREVADATAAVVRMADHIPAPLFAWGARAYGRSGQGRVNIVASNVPGPSQTQYLVGRQLLELMPWVPIAQEIRASAAMVSYAGRLTIGITGDAEALPDVDRLVIAVGREVDDLVAGCAESQA
jgi:diacylglycerol O-acyltransferase